jgi:hypothetical protein|nr:hypothetical protein [Kofleriaceae bacterium]
MVAMAAACGRGREPRLGPAIADARTYGELGASAVAALDDRLDAGGGRWWSCDGGCEAGNRDWGDDVLTSALWLRWAHAPAPRLAARLGELAATAVDYGPCAGSCTWSDVAAWDAVADLREHDATRDARALALARHAYDRARDPAYVGGACPAVPFQRARADGHPLKTLETLATTIEAAILLARATGDRRYLDDARAEYAAARAAFLDPDPALPLYTTYVVDDGRTCAQLPRRTFASVNGEMMWAGVALARDTGDTRYRDDAVATARAVAARLADARGVFANLQAENDVAEPLVEGMLALAESGDAPARAWLLRNAAAAAAARTRDGLYGRWWDGPRPRAPVTAWQTSGGLALAIAAAALAPDQPLPATDRGDAWATAREIRGELALPITIAFDGSAIAIYGALGDRCCEAGHARVELDGAPLVDATGVWQDKSSSGRRFPDTVLFAWRWPEAGHHVVALLPADDNIKEGGSYAHVTSYAVVP